MTNDIVQFILYKKTCIRPLTLAVLFVVSNNTRTMSLFGINFHNYSPTIQSGSIHQIW